MCARNDLEHPVHGIHVAAADRGTTALDFLADLPCCAAATLFAPLWMAARHLVRFCASPSQDEGLNKLFRMGIRILSSFVHFTILLP